MTNIFAVIDFETTGLSPHQGDRAIEIGVAVFDGDRVIDTYQSLMNPGVPVPYFIESLTGISQAMVERSPAASIVIREACEIIGDLPIVAHNASFDRNFYVAELGRIGRSYVDPFLCTMLIGRRLYPNSPNHKPWGRDTHFGLMLSCSMKLNEKACVPPSSTMKLNEKASVPPSFF